ncbi:ribonuclease H [Monosporozyma servazzii]
MISLKCGIPQVSRFPSYFRIVSSDQFTTRHFIQVSKNTPKKYYHSTQYGRSTNGDYNEWRSCGNHIPDCSIGVNSKFDLLGNARSATLSISFLIGSYGSLFKSSFTRSSYKGNPPYSLLCGGTSSPRKSTFSYVNPSYDNYFKRSYCVSTIELVTNNSNPSPKSVRSTIPKADSSNYYAVKSSNPARPSKVFNTWKECRSYAYRQKGISYKKFDSLEAANIFTTGYVPSFVDYNLIGMNKADFKQKHKVTTDMKFTKCCNVYCDGSALEHDTDRARAGYGVYFENEPENNISERLKIGAQTNSRGEIEAVSSALDKIWNNLIVHKDKTNYKIKTDSEYVAKLLNDIYGTYSEKDLRKLANIDLVLPMIRKYATVKKYYEINKDSFSNNGDFSIEWVKGHSGHEGNDMADELARGGAAKP